MNRTIRASLVAPASLAHQPHLRARSSFSFSAGLSGSLSPLIPTSFELWTFRLPRAPACGRITPRWRSRLPGKSQSEYFGRLRVRRTRSRRRTSLRRHLRAHRTHTKDLCRRSPGFAAWRNPKTPRSCSPASPSTSSDPAPPRIRCLFHVTFQVSLTGLEVGARLRAMVTSSIACQQAPTKIRHWDHREHTVE